MTYRVMLKYALIGAKACMTNSKNKDNRKETLRHFNNLRELERTYNMYKNKA